MTGLALVVLEPVPHDRGVQKQHHDRVAVTYATGIVEANFRLALAVDRWPVVGECLPKSVAAV